MSSTPAELRIEAESWLKSLNRRYPLNRHLFLIPGITDEAASCWTWIADWGRYALGKWDDYVTVVDLSKVGSAGSNSSARTFIEMGSYLHDLISDTVARAGSPAAQFDIIGHSMGGVDAYAALVPLLGSTHGSQLPTARYYMTLDTPFRGIFSGDMRCHQSDISDPRFPDRPTQCQALMPGSSQLKALLASREQLNDKVERVVCFGADREADIQVEWSSSNLCSDVSPQQLWPRAPAYRYHVIPGACHSGVGGITWSSITIAQIFNCLLFNV